MYHAKIEGSYNFIAFKKIQKHKNSTNSQFINTQDPLDNIQVIFSLNKTEKPSVPKAAMRMLYA